MTYVPLRQVDRQQPQLSGIFETFDKIMTKIDRYRSPNQESTFDLNSKLDKIIEIEYKLLSP